MLHYLFRNTAAEVTTTATVEQDGKELVVATVKLTFVRVVADPSDPGKKWIPTTLDTLRPVGSASHDHA